MSDEIQNEVLRAVDPHDLDDPWVPPHPSHDPGANPADASAETPTDQHPPYDDASRQELFPRDQDGFHSGGPAF
jgi:hypothetical protein